MPNGIWRGKVRAHLWPNLAQQEVDLWQVGAGHFSFIALTDAAHGRLI